MKPHGRRLSVDPGAMTGVAEWDGGVFPVVTGRVKRAGFADVFLRADWTELAIEIPVVRRGGVPPAGLIKLAVTAGSIIGFVLACSPNCRVRMITPETWKGQVPKEIHTRRIAEHFGMSGDTDHNELDAIGIGAFAFLGVKL